MAAGQLAVRPCGGRIRLTEGEHRVELRSTEQFQPVSIALTAAGPNAPVEPVPPGAGGVVRRHPARARRRTGRGGDPLDAAELQPGLDRRAWTAQELDPVQVDGWAQGWVLPEDTSGEVVLTFEPQRGYLITLIAGLVLLGLVLLWAAWVGLRTRLDRRRSTQRGRASSRSRVPPMGRRRSMRWPC